MWSEGLTDTSLMCRRRLDFQPAGNLASLASPLFFFFNTAHVCYQANQAISMCVRDMDIVNHTHGYCWVQCILSTSGWDQVLAEEYLSGSGRAPLALGRFEQKNLGLSCTLVFYNCDVHLKALNVILSRKRIQLDSPPPPPCLSPVSHVAWTQNNCKTPKHMTAAHVMWTAERSHHSENVRTLLQGTVERRYAFLLWICFTENKRKVHHQGI